MGAIPLVVMEEHHEAFFIWQAAVRLGWMLPRGNFLLHVDEHADIGVPRLRQPLVGLEGDLSDVLQFAFSELTCFEFIVPSVALGLFNELLWLRQSPERRSDQLVVMANTGGGEAISRFDMKVFPLFNGQVIGKPEIPPGERLRYRHQAIEHGLPPMQDVVLDVDLDYFSCEDAVNLVQKLEVTAQEYERFRNDRYHFLRIGQGSRIRMQEEGGRHFLYLRDYQAAAPTPLRVSESVILERIQRLVEGLKASGTRPRLIDFARSRHSGYTPADQWEFIETHLIEALGELYELDVMTLDDLQQRVGIERIAGAMA